MDSLEKCLGQRRYLECRRKAYENTTIEPRTTMNVCYKTCNDTDSDVFLVKLGSKQPSHNKKNTIEIELKTPKQESVMAKQKVTTETQINEAELDAALAGCKKGKKKGKGKKGKKKGKGRKGKKK